MPGRPQHNWITKLLTGTEGDNIHQALDAPFTLTGKVPTKELREFYKLMRPPTSKYTTGHRQALHTLEEAITMGYLLEGSQGARAALTHILADETLKSKEDKAMIKLLMALNQRR
jgi:hypothetical protein